MLFGILRTHTVLCPYVQVNAAKCPLALQIQFGKLATIPFESFLCGLSR